MQAVELRKSWSECAPWATPHFRCHFFTSACLACSSTLRCTTHTHLFEDWVILQSHNFHSFHRTWSVFLAGGRPSHVLVVVRLAGSRPHPCTQHAGSEQVGQFVYPCSRVYAPTILRASLVNAVVALLLHQIPEVPPSTTIHANDALSLLRFTLLCFALLCCGRCCVGLTLRQTYLLSTTPSDEGGASGDGPGEHAHLLAQTSKVRTSLGHRVLCSMRTSWGAQHVRSQGLFEET